MSIPSSTQIIDIFTQGVSLFGRLLCVMPTGSYAYNLVVENSDFDARGIFTPNNHYLLGLGVVEQVKVKGDDWVAHDIRQFVKLVLKLNPTILEMLFIEPLYANPLWFEMRDKLRGLITKNAFEPYSAYVRSQIAKALNRKPIGKRSRVVESCGFDCKFASHTARLAVQCIGLMNTGIIEVKLPEPYRSIILAIKLGKYTKDAAIGYCQYLDKQMYGAYQKTKLPESVDVDKFEKECYVPWIQAMIGFNYDRTSN